MSNTEPNKPEEGAVIGYRGIRNRETGELVKDLTPIYAEDWPYSLVHPKQPLLRYMDFWKFKDMMDSRELYFCRADKFDDPLEGTISKKGVHGTSASDLAFHAGVPISQESYEKMAAYRETAKGATFVNCWHMNFQECPRMWAEYTTSSDSVLVITTVEKLAAALKRRVMMSPVKYVNEENPRTEFGIHSLFLYKDDAFAHEQEYRLLIDVVMEEGTVFLEEREDFFRRVPIDVSCLVDKIQLHPGAGDETYEKVKAIVQRHLPDAEENAESDLFDSSRAKQRQVFDQVKNLNSRVQCMVEGNDCRIGGGFKREEDPGSFAIVEQLLVDGGCPRPKAPARAELLLSEIGRLGLPIIFQMPRTVPIGVFPDGTEKLADLVEYRIGDTGFSVENATEAKITAENTSGTSFDVGILTYLVRTLEVARQRLPIEVRERKWLREGLLNPRQHLNTLNEIWWLGRWNGLTGVEDNVQLHDDSAADIDWRFRFERSDLVVNLEVKRRPSDIRRLNPDVGVGARSLFEDRMQTDAGVPKFTPSLDETVNVLAITICCPINQEVVDAADEFIDTNRLHVDALVIWSWAGPTHFAICTGSTESKADRLHDHVAPSDEEDEQEIHFFTHPVLNRT